MSRFAERFHEQGLQQGIQQGEALILERLLRQRFGALPEGVQQRIEQANEQTLLTWSERVLTADRLDETRFCTERALYSKRLSESSSPVEGAGPSSNRTG